MMRLISIMACLSGAVIGGAVAASPGFDVLVTRAAAGDAASLRAVAEMRHDTDGARSDAIDKALSDALTTSPAVVLRLVQTQAGLETLDWYCQDRAIEPSAADVRRYDARATAALRKVGDPALRGARDRCLAHLHKDL